MLDLAIFAALDWERRAVTSALRDVTPTGAGRWTARLRADDGPSLVVRTGIGPERARAAAREVPDARAFISCGCAGALVPWLRPGDVVVASAVVPVAGDGRAADPLPADSALAASAAASGIRVHVGPFVSTPTVLWTAREKASTGVADALVVEMEGAALAAEARARGIPFIGVRVVLDVQAQALPALVVVDEASGEIRAGRAAAAVAVRPWLWPAVARLARQTRVAERALRAVVVALAREGVASAPVAAPAVAQ
jgi:nucleoside phosphorylase